VIAALATAGVFVASSTSYCPGSSSSVMADGTHTRLGSAASNRHPLGTRLRLIGARFLGRRTFVVRDRIGWGSDLDLWSPSCTASRRWGRRRVRYRVLHPRASAASSRGRRSGGGGS
jgi:3D (Asp-Asp-Asp) domain-containing protein